MRYLQIFMLVAGLSMAPSVVLAQAGAPQRPATPSTPLKPVPPQRLQPPASPPQSSPGVLIGQLPDARETRNQLNEIFTHQLPPSVREVLRIDPTLMYRPDYIGNYPTLAAFLEQHPEIAHNPAFFIGERSFDEQNNSPGMEAARALRNMVEFAGVVLIVMTITTGVILLVRTAVEHRRWQRALRTQTDLHTKLIDRFSSSDDLLAYLQSPAGKLLTDAPSLPQTTPRAAMAAPLSRIFWSLQAGIVIGALGAGLVFVSGTATIPEVSTFLNGVGIVVLMIGIGFTVSAAVLYFLSQRLGLVQSLSTRYSGEAPGS